MAQRYISDLTAVTLNDVYRRLGILYLLSKPLFVTRKIETIQHFIGINAPIRRFPRLTANFCQLLCILAVCQPKRHHQCIIPIMPPTIIISDAPATSSGFAEQQSSFIQSRIPHANENTNTKGHTNQLKSKIIEQADTMESQ